MPSIVKLLLRGRCPPIAGPAPAPTPPLEATPGLNSEAFSTPRPTDVVGSTLSSRFSNVCVRLVVVVSKGTAATAETSTTDVLWIGSVSVAVDDLPTSIRNAFSVYFEKPGADAVMSYTPNGTFEIRTSPVALVFAVKIAPVCSLTIVTVALGMTAPLVSFTVPAMLPLVVCAHTAPTIITKASKATAPCFFIAVLLKVPPLLIID